MAKAFMTGAMLVHDELIDHYKFPRHRGEIKEPHFTAALLNQSCGDRISITGRMADGVIVSCAFQGEGCVLSQAAASMLMEYIHAKSPADIAAIDAAYMQARVGVAVGPTRLRCVLLALETLRKALTS
ncbi:MAG: nitrogen fixation protein NifU [Candidatus Dependentiae bacterium]|nr:nitrogen fixation protein NifU [Candidatus Dependentiae bacterium]